MTLVEFALLALVACASGLLGQSLAGVARGGCLTATALGFIGAFFGKWIAQALELPEPFPIRIDSTTFPLMWAIVGSALFVSLLAAVGRGRGARS